MQNVFANLKLHALSNMLPVKVCFDFYPNPLALLKKKIRHDVRGVGFASLFLLNPKLRPRGNFGTLYRIAAPNLTVCQVLDTYNYLYSEQLAIPGL